MYPSTLTLICFQLIYAIDQGKIIAMKDIEHELGFKNDIFEFLNNSLPEMFDFSILDQADRKTIVAEYNDIAMAVGPEKFGVENNGLNELLAYTVELIQRERRVLAAKDHEF